MQFPEAIKKRGFSHLFAGYNQAGYAEYICTRTNEIIRGYLLEIITTGRYFSTAKSRKLPIGTVRIDHENMRGANNVGVGDLVVAFDLDEEVSGPRASFAYVVKKNQLSREEGVLVEVNPTGKFGFAESKNGQGPKKRVFVHVKQFQQQINYLNIGMRVSYIARDNPKGRLATHVRRIN